MHDLFKNVSIIKDTNVYFDGSKKTLGYMQAGEYEFGTESPELMELLGGSMDVKLAGEDVWTTYQKGESFKVPGNSKFALTVKGVGADYCCSYFS